jgi:DcuC family C4-dicarboxylate transporter
VTRECLAWGPLMTLILGLAIIVLAVTAVMRRIDVRLVLFLAALALGVLAGQPERIVRVFLETFSNERFVVPICTAMGFAYVIRHTGCDQHLVHLLVRPLRHVRGLLIPGTVLIAFLVNIPVVSQTSTAVTVGAVVIPILLAARLSPVTVGAVLLLGSSIGGELLNPGAPELRTTVEESRKAYERAGETTRVSERDCLERIAPLNFLGLSVATLVFWVISARAETRARRERSESTESATEPAPEFQVNLTRALIPLVPLLLLFLTGPPLNLVRVPPTWLMEPSKRTLEREAVSVLSSAPTNSFPAAVPWSALAATGRPSEPVLTAGEQGLFNTRLIGFAMLIGVTLAALAVRRAALGVAGAFFEGAGFGFAHIISLIVVARCFGEGVELIGLADVIAALIHQDSSILVVSAGSLALGFAVLCGSGMATTQSVFPFFAGPAVQLGVDPTLIGAVVSLASAAGRTMSPVAAVTLMCATLTKTNPLDLVRRVAIPLLCGISAVIVAALIMAMTG